MTCRSAARSQRPAGSCLLESSATLLQACHTWAWEKARAQPATPAPTMTRSHTCSTACGRCSTARRPPSPAGAAGHGCGSVACCVDKTQSAGCPRYLRVAGIVVARGHSRDVAGAGLGLSIGQPLPRSHACSQPLHATGNATAPVWSSPAQLAEQERQGLKRAVFAGSAAPLLLPGSSQTPGISSCWTRCAGWLSQLRRAWWTQEGWGLQRTRSCGGQLRPPPGQHMQVPCR